MKTNDESPFPKRLKEARKAKGLSQKQLGILAGMDQFAASARMNQYEMHITEQSDRRFRDYPDIHSVLIRTPFPG